MNTQNSLKRILIVSLAFIALLLLGFQSQAVAGRSGGGGEFRTPTIYCGSYQHRVGPAFTGTVKLEPSICSDGWGGLMPCVKVSSEKGPLLYPGSSCHLWVDDEFNISFDSFEEGDILYDSPGQCTVGNNTISMRGNCKELLPTSSFEILLTSPLQKITRGDNEEVFHNNISSNVFYVFELVVNPMQGCPGNMLCIP